MNPRRLAALLLAAAVAFPAAPASAGSLRDGYCVEALGFRFCSPPLPV
jgi:hypothetical protein